MRGQGLVSAAARRLFCAAIGGAVTVCAMTSMFAQSPADLRTRAEITNYRETTSYGDVMRLISDIVASSPLARWERFGATEEGRPLPLLMLSDPAVETPEDARALKRPIVFVMANIHGGEVEGKEASLILARRLTSGDLKPLLEQAVVLMAPIYNADGNERVSVENRPSQNGPAGGVGTRGNAKGLDLNRDFMKLDSAEARALVGLMRRWDPHVTIDLHTTNGSYHGYHLTYAPSLNPNTDARLIGFERERLLPEVREAVLGKHGFRTYYYGNFTSESGSSRETAHVDPAHPGDTAWRTFDHRPRFGTTYIGLRNRIAILSEAYSYLDFRRRVQVTEAFVEEVLRASAAHAERIMALTAQADRETATASDAELGVRFEAVRSTEPAEILVGEVVERPNPATGRPVRVMADTAVPVKMPEYGSFKATRQLEVPDGWLMPGALVESGALAGVMELLDRHGIEVKTVTAPADISVERFVIDTVERADTPFQGHVETTLTGRYVPAVLAVHEGARFVPADQPLARLAFYLLEAESDDGVVTWQVLDEGLTPGETFCIYRVMNRSRLKLAP